MKTTSLKRSKKPLGPRRNLFASAIVLCAVLAIVQLIFPSVLFRIAYAVSAPFTATRDFIGEEIKNAEIYFGSKNYLAAENAELKKDLSSVNVKLLSMQALETKNQALENMLATKGENKAAKTAGAVFAAVVERPPFSPYDDLIISQGGRSGITAGNPVFADDGTPLGIIDSIYPSSAKVLLLSSPNNSINVVIGTKKFETAAIGQGGGNFSAKTPVAAAPSEGDAVYIPEFSDAATGVVRSVRAGSTDTFATILFSLPENISEISYVTVDTASHFDINQKANEATSTNK